MEAHTKPPRILRLIARMNLGGPAHHVAVLSGRLDPEKWQTVLVTGDVGRGEEEHVDERVRVRHLADLGPDIRPDRDLLALWRLVRLMREQRPQIVHTHTAKAGMLGRLAALTLRPRPIIVHTYHGHVLRGYFGPAKSKAFTLLERALARISDRLVGVSSATVGELVALRVAAEEKFVVVPLGIDLERFLSLPVEPDRARREELGILPEEVVFTFVGRLAAIKRADLMLEALAAARRMGVPARVLVVGDGLVRPELEGLARRLGCADAVDFLGYRRDVAAVLAAADAALLTSDNEGTPVALIEAGAAARPAVATDVGGVSDIVVPRAGLLAPRGDERALVAAITELAGDERRRREMGAAAREHVAERYAAKRLLRDIDALYTELLADRERTR